MGTYLNPGNKGFQKILQSEYVDKTGMIALINKTIGTTGMLTCISRPRRFGKSMALEMLASYYSSGCDSRELFAGFKIENDESFPEHLNQCEVVYLNMQHFLIRADCGKVTKYLEQQVMGELQEKYAHILKGQEAEALQKQYLDFLRNLLKDQPYVALAYMTGILPVKKYGQHSALNMFWEYSMTNQYMLEEYTGFTEDEVKALCARFDMDFEKVSDWYDGYRLRRFHHIYNPRSVVAAMRGGVLSNYWTSTENYEALKVYMDMDFDGLRSDIVRMLGGEQVRVNTRSFQNDMRNFNTKDDVLTLLIHLGYLGYDSETEEAFIPNKEIMGEFENAMSVGG